MNAPLKLAIVEMAVCAFVAVILSGCASRDLTPAPNGPRVDLMSQSQYLHLIENNTQTKKVYDGFALLLEYRISFLNTPISLGQVDMNTQLYQYSDSQYQNEKGTTQSNLVKQTEFFLSLYIPDGKYDDLAKKNTKWKIFLDVAGQRYEAKAVRIKAQLRDVQNLYPFHDRFSTAYKLIFPVSTSITENGVAKLTLTGPMTSFSISTGAVNTLN